MWSDGFLHKERLAALMAVAYGGVQSVPGNDCLVLMGDFCCDVSGGRSARVGIRDDEINARAENESDGHASTSFEHNVDEVWEAAMMSGVCTFDFGHEMMGHGCGVLYGQHGTG